MSKKLLFLCLAMMPLASMAQQGWKDALGKYCRIGAAINQWQSDGQVPEADAVIDRQNIKNSTEYIRDVLKDLKAAAEDVRLLGVYSDMGY